MPQGACRARSERSSSGRTGARPTVRRRRGGPGLEAADRAAPGRRRGWAERHEGLHRRPRRPLARGIVGEAVALRGARRAVAVRAGEEALRAARGVVGESPRPSRPWPRATPPGPPRPRPCRRGPWRARARPCRAALLRVERAFFSVTPAASRKRATRSVACAPWPSQYCTRSRSILTRPSLSLASSGS